MSDSFDQMVKEFKSMAELRKFTEAQHKTIIDLTRKLNDAQELAKNSDKPKIVISTNLGISDEEIICRTQLRMLKEAAVSRELTLEEAKKFDIYTKSLENIEKKNEEPKELKEVDNEQLLSIVETNG